jgi:sec-independent protein translocase protein TatA
VGFIGFWEILIIALVLLLVFGTKRIPQVGRSVGRGLRELRDALPSSRDELEEKPPSEEKPRSELPPATSPRERDTVS